MEDSQEKIIHKKSFSQLRDRDAMVCSENYPNTVSTSYTEGIPPTPAATPAATATSDCDWLRKVM